MARQWKGRCVQCNAPLSYAEQLAFRDASIGLPRPIQCPKCDRLEARGLRATAMPEVRLQGSLHGDSGAPLGRIETPAAQHQLDERASGFVRTKFGVTDEEINALYDELLREDTPVVIAVAPTGSGKSTFVPYRLLAPEGLPLETFTAGKQIVITQPRRQAAIGITGYVAGTLHGAEIGIGHEVGYRVRGDHACDARNRMVYVTDGTLINWIVRGELDRIRMIVIDEAHERSLNIDVILGLLANALPQFPDLKVLIVSATIDHEKFRRHFDARLPGTMRCGVVECSGSKPKGLKMHWCDPAHGMLPYAKGPLRKLGRDVWEHLADAIVRLVVAMDSPGKQGAHPQLARGDVLGFLHGAKPIQDACDRIAARLQAEHPQLARNTDVYPLFANVDDETRSKAIDDKEDPSRRRIVIASNAAETSLTIDSLVHVIDTGFIKQTQWDPVLEDAPLLPIAHSQAGCRQRWGRVGRTLEGFSWSLYTKQQFETIFPRDTVPEIQRSCLDGVVLLAKRGGADQLSGVHFPWLDAPDDVEIDNTIKRLTRQGALDADGDLTAAGVDAAFSGGEEALYARLVADADRFGFGIEVATLLPFVKVGIGELFPDDRDWDKEKRRSVRSAQDRLKSGCADDLELCLRAYQDWASLKTLPKGARWKPPAVPRRLRRQIREGEEGAAALQEELKKARTVAGVHQVIERHTGKKAGLKSWIDQVVGTFRSALRADWAQRNGVDAAVIEDVAASRADTIRELGAKKKDLEDRAIDFAGLDRLRILIARAFPQSLYAQSSPGQAGFESETSYAPVNPDQPDPPRLLIGNASCCRARPPETLIALGPKQSIPVKEGDEAQQPRVRTPFVVSIERNVWEKTASLSDLGLADYFREFLPRPAIGSEEDRRQQIHSQLRRDFPTGTVVQCRVKAVLEDDIRVQVLKPVGWAGKRLGPLGSSASRREKSADRHERDFDFRYASKKNGKGQKKPRVHALEDELLDPTDEDTPEGSDWTAKQFYQNRGRPESLKNASQSVAGRLRMLDGRMPEPGEVVLAEVSQHADLRAQPGLMLTAPESRARFRMFRERYQPRAEVQVQVLGPTQPGALVQGLMVREAHTGLETTIALEDFASFSERALLGVVPIGAVIPVRVERIDEQQQSVTLSNLARWEAAMRKLKEGSEYAGHVVRVDHNERNVYVLVVLSVGKPEEGIVLPAKIVMFREMFETPDGQLRLPFAAGAPVHIQLRRTEQGRSRTRVADITAQESALLKKSQISVDDRGRLTAQGPMRLRQRDKLLTNLTTASVRDAVCELFLARNEIYGDRVITDLEKRFPPGKVVQGKVTWVNGEGIKLALPDGVAGRVAPNEISWWDDRLSPRAFASVDDVFQVKVLGVQAAQQIVQLSIRQLTANPWQGGIRKLYPEGQLFEGEVRNLISNRAFVSLEPGLDGSIHVSAMKDYRGGEFVHESQDVLQVGDRVQVRVISINLAKRQIALYLKDVLGKRTVQPPASAIKEEAAPVEPPDWNGPQWPWTDGENAIKKRQKPTPPPRPESPVRVPLEERSSPGGWTQTWQ